MTQVQLWNLRFRLRQAAKYRENQYARMAVTHLLYDSRPDAIKCAERSEHYNQLEHWLRTKFWSLDMETV